MAPKKVAVQLPATISFVGSAEVKTSSGDFISGGKDIGAPQVVDCGAGVQALVFNIPSYSRDFNSGDDDSIVVDLFDDLFNSVAESFTIKISGTAPKANLSVHAADDIALE